MSELEPRRVFGGPEKGEQRLSGLPLVEEVETRTRPGPGLTLSPQEPLDLRLIVRLDSVLSLLCKTEITVLSDHPRRHPSPDPTPLEVPPRRRHPFVARDPHPSPRGVFPSHPPSVLRPRHVSLVVPPQARHSCARQLLRPLLRRCPYSRRSVSSSPVRDALVWVGPWKGRTNRL